MHNRTLVSWLIPILLIGCGDFPPVDELAKLDDRFSCHSPIVGAGASVSESVSDELCVHCDGENLQAVIDGDPESGARVTIVGVTRDTGEGYRLKVQAQAGVVFPAGSLAGVRIRYPDPGYEPQITIRTLLSGEVQESATAPVFVLSPAGAVHDLGFETTRHHDGIEVVPTLGGVISISELRPGAGRGVVEVLQVCSDSD